MDDLLITTMNGIFLYQNRKQRLLQPGNFYGLTWDSEYIYASYNRPHKPISRIVAFNRCLIKQYTLSDYCANGIHQILSYDNLLYITNTQKDRLDILQDEQLLKEINWTGHDRDTCHINSIWINDNRVYVTESGLAGNSHPPTIQILDMTYNLIERIELSHAIHIHNVYIENDTLYTCGKFGLVVQKDKVIDLRVDQANGFFRGLARSDTYFYIGESQELPRSERAFGDSRILALDNDLNLQHVIELKDTGQIKDIRIINGHDYAHNGIELDYVYPI